MGDLQSYIIEHGMIPVRDVQFISKQMLRGIEFMHSNNFAHRDLKPANLLIKAHPPNGAWWIKISDFGISKKMQQSRSFSQTVCGTLGFMAPELLGFHVPQPRPLSSLDSSKAADMWAAGETIFRMLTGEAAFQDNLMLLSQYVNNVITFPGNGLLQRKGVPVQGVNLIRACMAPDPAFRPSATAAIEDKKWVLGHAENSYEKSETRHMATILCDGHHPPFILSIPSTSDILILTKASIRIVRLDNGNVQARYVTGRTATHFTHASSSKPNGQYLCIMQMDKAHGPLILSTQSLKVYKQLDDALPAGHGQRISTFGRYTLVTAHGRFMRKILVGHLKFKNRDMVSVPEEAGSIESMQFTSDDSQLVLACEKKVIIKNTSTNAWTNLHIVDYPCNPISALDICPDPAMVVCESSRGVLWLWEAATNCWARRNFPPGGPDKMTPPLKHLNFSGTGESIVCSGSSEVEVFWQMAFPLDKFGSHSLRGMDAPKGLQPGMSVFLPELNKGATAFGGNGSEEAAVVAWTCVIRD